MAQNATIYIDQLATFITSFSFMNSNNTPVDLTGYSATGVLSKYYNSNTYINFLTNIPQPNNGILYIALTPNTTANIAYGQYIYNIFLTDSANNITKAVEGLAIVNPSIGANINQIPVNSEPV